MTPVRMALVCLLALGSVAPLSADFKDSYRRAIQARNRQNWTDAVQWLYRAIEERATETGEAVNISGALYEPYLPYFHLGMAHFNMQDCGPALEAWKTSLQAQAVLRSKYAEVFKKSQFECEGRLRAAATLTAARPADPAGKPAEPVAKPAEPVTKPADPVAKTETPAPSVNPSELASAAGKAEDAITAAQRAGLAVRQLAGDPLLKTDWVQQSGLIAAQTRAEGFLGEARTALDVGRRNADLKTLASAATIAASAGQQFELLRQAAQNRKDQLEAEARAASRTSPEKPPAPELAPTPAAIAAPVPVPPKTNDINASLLSLLDAYMSGRYRDAAALARKLPMTGKEGAQAALFGAAATYAQFLRGGERDRALRDEALRYANIVRRLDPALQPDIRVFSPRFAEFFRQAR